MLEITEESHLDHITPAHARWLQERYSGRDTFFLETIDIPESLPAVTCALYGPTMGDEPVLEERVHYAIRGSRKWASRLIKLSPRPTRKLTVIAGPIDDRLPSVDESGNTVFSQTKSKPCVLYTAYGGPSAPREPGDTDMQKWEQVLEARSFWKVHALAADPAPRLIRTSSDIRAFVHRVKDGVEEARKSYVMDETTIDNVLVVVAHELEHAIRGT